MPSDLRSNVEATVHRFSSDSQPSMRRCKEANLSEIHKDVDTSFRNITVFADCSSSMIGRKSALGRAFLRGIQTNVLAAHTIGTPSCGSMRQGGDVVSGPIEVDSLVRDWRCGGSTYLWEYVDKHIQHHINTTKDPNLDVLLITDGEDNRSSGEFFGPEGYEKVMNNILNNYSGTLVRFTVNVLFLGDISPDLRAVYVKLSARTNGRAIFLSEAEVEHVVKVNQNSINDAGNYPSLFLPDSDQGGRRNELQEFQQQIMEPNQEVCDSEFYKQQLNLKQQKMQANEERTKLKLSQEKQRLKKSELKRKRKEFEVIEEEKRKEIRVIEEENRKEIRALEEEVEKIDEEVTGLVEIVNEAQNQLIESQEVNLKRKRLSDKEIGMIRGPDSASEASQRRRVR